MHIRGESLALHPAEHGLKKRCKVVEQADGIGFLAVSNRLTGRVAEPLSRQSLDWRPDQSLLLFYRIIETYRCLIIDEEPAFAACSGPENTQAIVSNESDDSSMDHQMALFNHFCEHMKLHTRCGARLVSKVTMAPGL